jgi:hypothetical protein
MAIIDSPHSDLPKLDIVEDESQELLVSWLNRIRYKRVLSSPEDAAYALFRRHSGCMRFKLGFSAIPCDETLRVHRVRYIPGAAGNTTSCQTV